MLADYTCISINRCSLRMSVPYIPGISPPLVVILWLCSHVVAAVYSDNILVLWDSNPRSIHPLCEIALDFPEQVVAIAFACPARAESGDLINARRASTLLLVTAKGHIHQILAGILSKERHSVRGWCVRIIQFQLKWKKSMNQSSILL